MIKKTSFVVFGVWYHALDYYEMMLKKIKDNKEEVINVRNKSKNQQVYLMKCKKIIQKNESSDSLLICAKNSEILRYKSNQLL